MEAEKKLFFTKLQNLRFRGSFNHVPSAKSFKLSVRAARRENHHNHAGFRVSNYVKHVSVQMFRFNPFPGLVSHRAENCREPLSHAWSC